MLAPPTLWVSRRRVFYRMWTKATFVDYEGLLPLLVSLSDPPGCGEAGNGVCKRGNDPCAVGIRVLEGRHRKHTAFSRRPCQLLHNKLETSADLSSAQGSNVRAAAAELGWIHGLDPVRDFSVPSINRWTDSNQTLSHRRSPPLLLAKNSLKCPRETIKRIIPQNGRGIRTQQAPKSYT